MRLSQNNGELQPFVFSISKEERREEKRREEKRREERAERRNNSSRVGCVLERRRRRRRRRRSMSHAGHMHGHGGAMGGEANTKEAWMSRGHHSDGGPETYQSGVLAYYWPNATYVYCKESGPCSPIVSIISESRLSNVLSSLCFILCVSVCVLEC